ncbi:ATP-grasp domain-containing protein [Actinacidiphila acididurans]|uniref:ATP-grasp domain-containing protein n=1 Tax=Actinacidiphila acididurans TaxID=2784346 RepID=A0ABS2TMW1_9ACTN|nr:ATP-grasp domain-containing protein [Actinacidiphila acididurans]MBM9504331.1 ATP-grasp domain-containing protein [Actinacidiphila acididurans]
MTAALLTCCDPLRPRRPDPHFAAAAETAKDLGSDVALVDHEALMQGRAQEAVARVPRGLGPLWYRGWMLPSSRYAELANALAERGSPLATDALRYRRAHELPGWYETFAAVTPRSVWLPADPGVTLPAARLAESAAPLGPGPVVVKDYVKSRKHEWDEACFVPDVADAERLAAVAGRFVELQGDFLTGGIVLRAFEDFTGDEVRVWWIDGDPVLVTVHPDAGTGAGTAEASVPGPELDRLAPLVRALGCRFVTTDLALRSDGVRRVVEVGDGQVSDLPASANQRHLLEPLLHSASN